MIDLRPEIAEAIGTFFLVLAGCGAIMAGAPALAIALAFGLTIMVLVYALGHVCGAHFNPAITLAFAVAGHFPWRRVASYVIAQVIGATLAAFTLRTLLGPVASVGATIPSVAPIAALVVETLATFLLALVIIAVATDPRAAPGTAGLAIGGAVIVDAIAFGALTGASMNPARSFGPALASGAFGDLWIDIVGPVAGAIAAMLAYEWLRPAARPKAGEPALGAAGAIEGLEARE